MGIIARLLVATVLVGTGLMGLVFLSSRSGHDDEANRGERKDDVD